VLSFANRTLLKKCIESKNGCVGVWGKKSKKATKTPGKTHYLYYNNIYVLFWIAGGLWADAAQAAGFSGSSRRRAEPELRAGTPSKIRPTMVLMLGCSWRCTQSEAL
jgi:hypothetical protein